ncbi:MAG: excinuclease ABC subunit A [Nitrospiraceae bacterium]|nr:MAG: excinuclease ABC subunit A [Nitrospiraceae bacterium]
MSGSELIIEGVKQNNLRNISLRLPHNLLICITGVSGSGKSSLAFDTIFAEGQWRFIESLSTYARLFLEKLDRPDVESIRNIRPAIALEQRNPVKTSRSTVGTSTEIYDYLRLLYAKIARPHCPQCGRSLRAWSPSSAAKELIEKYIDQKAMILFDTEEPPRELMHKGFHRIWTEGEARDISSLITERDRGPSQSSPVSVLLDRLVIKDGPRLADSLETAWEHGNGRVKVEIVREAPAKNEILYFSSGLECHNCNLEIMKPQPLLFSFNHPLGACPECKGFGNILEYSGDCIVPDKDLTLEQGAIEPWSKPAYKWWYRQFARAAKAHGIRLNVPYKDLPDKAKELIRMGNSDFYGLKGFFEYLEGRRYKLHVRVFLSRYRKAVTCGHCLGKRLRPEALAFTIGGLDVAQLTDMSIAQMKGYFLKLALTEYERGLSSEILRQINLKLDFLMRVGIGYLTLNRESRTLSGGETQRINLANQLASKLTGTLYVLDEPTVGLHPRDVGRIAVILKELADAGNTVIVVEHDRAVIDLSDWIVELGPGGGRNGGQVLFSGWKKDFLKTDILTAEYLKNIRQIPVPSLRKKGSGKMLVVKDAHGNNLKHIDITIPLQTLTCVTGVSGSGKSTIVTDTIYRALALSFKIEFEPSRSFESIKGLEYLKGVRIIDQRPIGKSPRSNPVTYIKAFDHIRKIFAEQPQSRIFGYAPGHFSFNTEGGRCEACQGAGFRKLEMYFFEDLYVTCEECGGRRYKPEILSVMYNGKNIYEVLELTVDEAVDFFRAVPALINKLRLMSSVGLGYLRLGQPATTLSGGEAQRLKICEELGVLNRREHLYILDEPTVGLHPDDIKKLLRVLNELVDAGNTVLLVEHNLDVIKCADWIIDIGPEGGDEGGYIVAEGTPEDIARTEKSHTGRFLKEYLEV